MQVWSWACADPPEPGEKFRKIRQACAAHFFNPKLENLKLFASL